MRIGLIYLGRRGSGGAHSFEIAQHLSAQTEVISFVSRQSEQFPRWQSSGLDVQAFETFDTGLQAISSLLFDRRIRNLAKAVSEAGPDVLLFPMLHPWNPRVQAFLSTIPQIVMVHDARPHAGPVDRIYAWMENQSIRMASQVVVFSQAMVPFILSRGGEQERTSVVPLPVIHYYQAFPPADSLSALPNPTKLLFFGRITSYKGLEVLLHAYRSLDTATRPPLQIVGAGNLAPYREEMKGIEDLQVENRWVSDAEIPRYFTPGTIVVAPYTSASQSGVIEVAAAYGLPVIGSRAGGIPEQIQDGVTGLLVDPGNVEQLRLAMLRLLDEPGFANNLGERLRQVTEIERGWPVTTRRLMEVVHKALLIKV
jgi:glycosyltransferase involved in cell wall biosynthesis